MPSDPSTGRTTQELPNDFCFSPPRADFCGACHRLPAWRAGRRWRHSQRGAAAGAGGCRLDRPTDRPADRPPARPRGRRHHRLVAHPDLAGRTVAGWDFVADTITAQDGEGRDADPSDPGDCAAATAAQVRGTAPPSPRSKTRPGPKQPGRPCPVAPSAATTRCGESSAFRPSRPAQFGCWSPQRWPATAASPKSRPTARRNRTAVPGLAIERRCCCPRLPALVATHPPSRCLGR